MYKKIRGAWPMRGGVIAKKESESRHKTLLNLKVANTVVARKISYYIF